MALSPPAAHLSAKFLEWAWKPGAALLILLLTSCTQIATVRHHDVALVASGRTDLSGIEAELAESQKVEHSEPLRALGGYLASADAATNLLKVHPHDSGAMHTYNFAV